MRRLAFLLVAALAGAPAAAEAAPRTSFKVAWSIYVGWMPWPYAQESGILKKWADKYGISIDLVEVNDYVESVNQYAAGAFDGVAVTNMDCLSIPSAGGVDTTAVILGDYSNGNDAVILKAKPGSSAPLGLSDMAKRRINLVQLSVSQYLLSRALEAAKLSERDVTLVNTSDADIVAAFGTSGVEAVVTWNPQVSEILKDKSARSVFDSSRIPGEIIDMLAVKSDTLKDNPALGMALAGAWYETMTLMSGNDAAARESHERMAKESGADLASFDRQLATTHMFYGARDAAAFADSPALVDTMQSVRTFAFDHGLLGPEAKSVDAVGIAFPGGQTLGDPKNVKLRFDDSFMKLAVDGKL